MKNTNEQGGEACKLIRATLTKCIAFFFFILSTTPQKNGKQGLRNKGDHTRFYQCYDKIQETRSGSTLYIRHHLPYA